MRRQGKRGEAQDPERARLSAAARARRELRRWLVQNRAYRMLTVTFRDEPTLDGGWEAIEGFRRRLRDAGYRQPAVVPQYGTQGGRLHFHLAMRDYVPKDELERLWGLGFVDVRVLKPRTSSRTTMSHRDMARLAAGYLAGYVGDPGPADEGAPDRDVGFNRKRYSIPQDGDPVEVVRFTSFGLPEAWRQAQAQCGHVLHEVWHSPPDDDAWRGPPTLVLMG